MKFFVGFFYFTGWKEVYESLKANPSANFPSKDVLLIASIDSKTGIEQMKDKMNKIIRTGDHTLTRWIFKRENQKWEPYIQIDA